MAAKLRFFMMAPRTVLQSAITQINRLLLRSFGWLAFAACALAVLPFNSMTITSISLSPVFSGKWLAAALYWESLLHREVLLFPVWEGERSWRP